MLSLFIVGLLISCKVNEQYAAAAQEKKVTTVVAGIYLILIAILKRDSINNELISCLFWPSIVLAAHADSCTKEIFDFTYFPAALAGTYQAIRNWNIFVRSIPELMIFILFQWLLCRLFRFQYGESDSLAFMVCAFYMTAAGSWSGLQQYLVFMLEVFIVLAIVQGCRKNITKKGNLKEPVALIPYIAGILLFW